MKIRNIRYWILIADLLCSFAALGIAIGLRYSGVRGEINFTAHFWDYFPTIITTLGIWVFLYFEMSLDGFKGGWHLPAISSRLIVAVSLLMTGVLAFAFVSRHYYSRLILFYFALSFVLGLVGVRCLARFLVTSQVKHLDNHRSVILGNGQLARELADKIASHPELPFHIVGF